MKYLLHTNFDCFVKINNQPYKLFAGLDKIISICNAEQAEKENNKMTANNSDFFEIYPQSVFGCGYCFEIEKNSEFSHPLAKLYKLDSDNAILLLNENEKTEKKSLSFLSTAENDYELLQSEKLELRCANQPIYKANFIATNGNIDERENLIFVRFENKAEKRLIVLDKQNNILIKDTISSLEYTENGFQTLLVLYDIHKQGLVKKYIVENNSLTLKEEYAVYINSQPKKLANSVYIPLAFFECIRAKNFSLAKKYLNSELNSKITNEHFVAYFGEFDIAIDCSKMFDKNIFALLSNKNKTCKLFEIDYSNNQIQNIVLIEK